MPSSQSVQDPNNVDASHTGLSNGASHHDGDQEEIVHSSSGGSEDRVGTGASAIENSLQAQKEKAKAQLSSSELRTVDEVVKRRSTLNMDVPQAPTQALNGIVHTRKRSRSGTRISRPVDNTRSVIHRGQNDPDGKLIEMVKTFQYTERDMIHKSAANEMHQAQQDLHRSKWVEMNYHRAMRGYPQENNTKKHPPNQPLPSPSTEPVRRIADDAVIKAFYGHGYGQYGRHGNDVALQKSVIMLNDHRPRAGGRAAKHVRIGRRALHKHADQLDDLVPIRLDIEWEHPQLGKIRLRDTFTWNLHDRLVPVDTFAQNLVEDFGLRLHQCLPLVQQVSHAIQEQIQDYYPHVFVDMGPIDDQLPYKAHKDDELRITIKLNITIGQHTLVDQFEWDINNSSESAEIFARQMAQELSLSGEFTTAIAHSIREQCQLFTRSLYILGHSFNGQLVTDEDLKSGLSPSPMPSAFRTNQAAKEFAPYFYELNDAELEKTELSLSREERRQKRSVHRRGGPALPDIKDRQRTIRTLVLSSVIPGAAETIEDSRILKRAPVASVKSKRPGPAKDGDDDSEDMMESEDSAPEDSVPQNLSTGTARTRGIRGAAAVAQTAMRGTLGRSTTPEPTNLHHHETRTSGRRFGGRDYREESVEDSTASLIVKLKFSRKDRVRRLLQDFAKSKTRPAPIDAPTLSTRRSVSVTPGQATPIPGAMGPPNTPGSNQQQPHLQQGSPGQLRDGQPINPLHPHAAQLGRVEASGPPNPSNPAV